jgi:hypothetical protein
VASRPLLVASAGLKSHEEPEGRHDSGVPSALGRAYRLEIAKVPEGRHHRYLDRMRRAAQQNCATPAAPENSGGRASSDRTKVLAIGGR